MCLVLLQDKIPHQPKSKTPSKLSAPHCEGKMTPRLQTPPSASSSVFTATLDCKCSRVVDQTLVLWLSWKGELGEEGGPAFCLSHHFGRIFQLKLDA